MGEKDSPQALMDLWKALHSPYLIECCFLCLFLLLFLHIHHGILLSSGSGLVLNGIGVSIERVGPGGGGEELLYGIRFYKVVRLSRCANNVWLT